MSETTIQRRRHHGDGSVRSGQSGHSGLRVLLSARDRSGDRIDPRLVRPGPVPQRAGCRQDTGEPSFSLSFYGLVFKAREMRSARDPIYRFRVVSSTRDRKR